MISNVSSPSSTSEPDNCTINGVSSGVSDEIISATGASFTATIVMIRSNISLSLFSSSPSSTLTGTIKVPK